MAATARRARAVGGERRRAMGSDAHVLVVTDRAAGPAGATGLLARAWARVGQLEARWSRFRPGSEVSALNRSCGTAVAVSDDTFALVSHAVAAWELTGGRFDPTVGAAVASLGYDRDFAGVSRVAASCPVPGEAVPVPGPAGIELDPGRSTVTLPPGVSIDPGGIGKGLAADLVAGALLDAGALGALVNLGGDLRAAGDPPGVGGWAISLPDPLDGGRELARFSLDQGAVATSSRLRRQWRTTAGAAHHLIDPATGRPAAGDIVAVTVVADRGWRAEALTKAIFLGEPGDMHRHPEAHAIVVTAGGGRYASPALAGALR